MATLLSWKMPAEKIIQKTFSSRLMHALLDVERDHERRSFAWIVDDVAQEMADVDLGSKSPESVEHFLWVFKNILSANAKEQISLNLHWFDRMCETPMANSLIGHCTFGMWLRELCEAVMRADKTAASLDLSEFSSNSSTAGTVFSRRRQARSSETTVDMDSRLGMMYDGTSDTPEPPSKIIQVNLTGHTITSAWMNDKTIVDRRYNATLRKLEYEMSLPRTSKPDEAGAPTVFHGTNAHFSGYYGGWEESWQSSNIQLAASLETDCQMNPRHVGVAYTAFSPLRAFLWVAFRSTIYAQVPSKHDINQLSLKWKCQGETYQGAAVFAFDILTPAPANLSWAIVPEDRGPAFNSRVKVMNQSIFLGKPELSPDEAWTGFRDIIGSTTSKWPDVLHSAEYGQQKQLLRPFPCSLWRTCWLKGPGLDALNEGYKFTMAITFTLTPAPIAPPKAPVAKAPPKEDKDKKHWRQSLRQKLSKLSLSGGKTPGQA